MASKIGCGDFEALRTYLGFKETLNKILLVMIFQLGPPTFFVNFSTAQHLWQELITCLKALNLAQKEPGKTIVVLEHQLICSYTITCACYCVHVFEAIRKLLASKENILGTLEDNYFVL